MTIRSAKPIRKILIVSVIALFALGALAVLLLKEGPEPNASELSALNEILESSLEADDFEIVTDQVLTKERRSKFKAVKKVFITPEGHYAFITKPVAYNGPIDLAVIIDADKVQTMGMKIVEHIETEHYVRDMYNDWFTDRFSFKNAKNYLRTVKLNARSDDEIVVITGATVTTDAIVNGVNACMGLFQEVKLGAEAEKVAYMVRFEKDEGDGPEETETIAIRAYGVVLGEISLEQIKQMPSVVRRMTIRSTAGTTHHDFRGTLLSNVLEAFDPNLLDEYDLIQPVGVDDYLANIFMDEVLAENKVYLMYEDNGQPLEKKNKEPGSMRVVVLDDFFGQRFTNYLIEIVLE